MSDDTRTVLIGLLMLAAAVVVGVVVVKVLRRMDGALRQRSVVGLVLVRTVTGLLAAFGLAAWLSVWFQRNLWLGIAQAVTCSLVIANELGLLGSSRSRAH